MNHFAGEGAGTQSSAVAGSPARAQARVSLRRRLPELTRLLSVETAWRPGARVPTRAVGVGRTLDGSLQDKSDEPSPHSCLSFPTRVEQNLPLKGARKVGGPELGQEGAPGVPASLAAPLHHPLVPDSPMHHGGANHTVFPKRLSVAPCPAPSPLPHS